MLILIEMETGITGKEVLDYVLKLVPICISLIALFFSLKANRNKEREDTPNFSIVQNLWTDSPRYELRNEAGSKLDKIPSPSYFMLIPTKVYFVAAKDEKSDGEVQSLLTLTPVSYELVTEQIVSGNTTGSIVTSGLPANFTAKKGERDVIRSGVVDSCEGIEIYINTYPFLVIVSEICYYFRKKERTDVLISTPLETQKLSREEYKMLMQYVRDNAGYEVSLPENGDSIYEKVNHQVIELFKNMKEHATFFCAVEGGYGNIMKKINAMITPRDPLARH